MYTIQVFDSNRSGEVFHALQQAITLDGRFKTRRMWVEVLKTTREDRKTLGKVYTLPAILIQGIRLTYKKPYCGQHAAQECPVGTRKPNMSLCEWNDWINFHNLINATLDHLQVAANVWTLPLEVKGKFWIRKGMKARVRFDADISYNSMGRRVEHWNLGDDTQFEV
jgi:hypothetical protein